MTTMYIDLFRHGEPVGGRRYRGYGIDDPLSENGWSQMWAAVGNEIPWKKIMTSPLRRCLDFAETLAERHGLPVQVDDRLKEVGFGEWEGRSPGEIQANNLADYEAFYRDPVSNRPAGAEPLSEFFTRAAASYESIIKQNAGQHVLVVAHAGVVRAVMAHVLGISPAIAYRIHVSNAGMTRFRHDSSGARLEFHNRTQF